ncbi:hypothetical protein DVH24_021827 [Malus domestica]|uniref:Uncharacterized protein n=1 Tax=Malus domestica TaxID=3750 RepID=A0A498IWR6_MALDO|nr:hypothetical protein DVH24_021827 [Malus domestica]
MGSTFFFIGTKLQGQLSLGGLLCVSLHLKLDIFSWVKTSVAHHLHNHGGFSFPPPAQTIGRFFGLLDGPVITRVNFRFCPRPFFFYCNFAPFACCQTENICFAVKRRTKWDAWVFPASSLCLFDSLFILSTASILLSQFHSLLNFFLSRFRCFLSTASIFLQLAAGSSIKPYKSFCCFWALSFLSLLLAFPNLESSSFPRKRNLKSTTQNSVIVAQQRKIAPSERARWLDKYNPFNLVEGDLYDHASLVKAIDQVDDSGFCLGIKCIVCVGFCSGMMIDPIRSLSHFQFNKKIRVRVCRIWRPKVIGKDAFGGLQCILVDEMLKPISSTILPTIVTSSTKSSIRKSLFSSENRKKQKRETEITEEIDEQNASNIEDFPIKSLRNKVSPSKSEIVFAASKTRKNKCKDD